MEKLDPELIYNPAMSAVPRVKNVFRITKEHHHGIGCRSSHRTATSMCSPILAPSDISQSEGQVTSGIASSVAGGSQQAAVLTNAPGLGHLEIDENAIGQAQRGRLTSHPEMLFRPTTPK